MFQYLPSPNNMVNMPEVTIPNDRKYRRFTLSATIPDTNMKTAYDMRYEVSRRPNKLSASCLFFPFSWVIQDVQFVAVSFLARPDNNKSINKRLY